MKRLPSLLFFFVLFSCSDKKSPNPSKDINDNIEITGSSFEIKPDEAIKISQEFWKSKTSDSSTSRRVRNGTKEVESIKEYKKEDKTIICYILNYKEKGGYLILSSDKRMVPILAYSDEGYFDENTDNPGIQYWLNLVVDAAKETKKLKKVANDVEWMWQKYDKQNAKNKRIAEIECPSLPNDINIEHLTDNLSIWGQGMSYNFHSPVRSNSNSCDCGKAAVGCGPVAMAQVLRYHRKQISINGTIFNTTSFDNMARNLPTNTCSITAQNHLTVSWLLRCVGTALSVDYNLALDCQTVLLSPSNIVSQFNSLGYNSYQIDFYGNSWQVENEIMNFRPVILYGSNCNVCISNAHIWVVDGLRKSYWYEVVEYYDYNIGTWEECVLRSTTEFQMNWGWRGGGNNGFFTIYNFNGLGTIYNNSGMKAYIIHP